jgi:type II secretory pathway pseudopilin PulG
MNRRRGFSSLELMVVTLVIVLGYAAVWHVAQGVTGRARTSSCSSNLRQLALAAHGYAADYDRLPQPAQGMIALMPYIKNQQIFVDPAAPEYVPPSPPFAPDEGPPEKQVSTDYLLRFDLRPDDSPLSILVADNVRNRHDGRWLGVRLDAACFLWPASAWDEQMGWVNSDVQTR